MLLIINLLVLGFISIIRWNSAWQVFVISLFTGIFTFKILRELDREKKKVRGMQKKV